MNGPLLSIRNLTVNYFRDGQSLTAVKDVSFSLERGKCLAIVGESGCGKSTIAHATIGLLPKHESQVARGEIQIVGPPLDHKFARCRSFESEYAVEVDADLLVPAIGFRSTLEAISSEKLRVRDFYLGCCHVEHSDLFLVGFARPIIGNIPTISEVQARYICSLISGRVRREPQIAKLHQIESERNRKQFAKLNLDAIYPVEMFPYCDELARWMGEYPSMHSIGSLLSWCREQLTPATTLHYSARHVEAKRCFEKSRIYMPPLLIGLLLLLKPVDWFYRFLRLGR